MIFKSNCWLALATAYFNSTFVETSFIIMVSRWMSLSLYFLDLSVCAGILSSFYYVIYHNQTLELKIKTQNNAINRHDSYKYTERLISIQ